jgi:hypothetical protein
LKKSANRLKNISGSVLANTEYVPDFYSAEKAALVYYLSTLFLEQLNDGPYSPCHFEHLISIREGTDKTRKLRA